MTLKQKALAHYDRMIKWAEKQPKRKLVDCEYMYESIGEIWVDTDCAYCKKIEKYNLDCNFCRLCVVNYDSRHCCGGT